MKKSYLLTVFSLLVCTIWIAAPTARAQKEQKNMSVEKMSSQSDESLKKFIYDFTAAYAALAKSKDKESVLKYFHKASTADITVVNIANRTNVMRGGYENFSAHLQNMLDNENIQISHEVSEILKTYIRGNIGVAAYVDQYEITQGNSPLVKGTQLVNIVCKNINGEWKSIHYSIVEIEDEKLKGLCLCELFESMGREAEYISKTTLPSGSNYSTLLDNFTFRDVADGKMIKTGDRIYKWNTTGELFYQEEEGISLKMIGRTLDHDEVIKMILEKDIYSDNCIKIQLVNPG